MLISTRMIGEIATSGNVQSYNKKPMNGKRNAVQFMNTDLGPVRATSRKKNCYFKNGPSFFFEEARSLKVLTPGCSYHLL